MSDIVETWGRVLGDSNLRQRYIQFVEERNTHLGCFLSFDGGEFDAGADSLLPFGGLPMAIKDNIAVKGRPLTCASRILENFVAPYTATAVEKLEKAGAIVVGKTNLDEFGMGSSNEHSGLGTTVNPWDNGRVPGGSSGGSAVAVAAGLVPLALGSDTGGSVRQPANFCGVYGLKPTYGSVSRFGLTAYASSLEVIGLMTRDIDLLEAAYQIVAEIDEKDQSTLNLESPEEGNGKILMLSVPPGTLDHGVEEAYKAAAEALRAAGRTVETFDFPSLDLVAPAYYTIATAEASANLARYNGIRYGYAPEYAENPVELMRHARHEGFGDEVKLRILLGTYVLRSGFQDQYYGRAQKVRTLIRNELAQVFKSGDIILMPVFPTQAFPRGEGGMEDYRQRIADMYTALANLAGLPALAIPTGEQGGLPTGVQVMAPPFGEPRLFDVARTLAGDYPLQMAPGALDVGSL